MSTPHIGPAVWSDDDQSEQAKLVAAQAVGFRSIALVIADADGKSGVQHPFQATFLPQVGDDLFLADGKKYQVSRIIHEENEIGGFRALIPKCVIVEKK